MTVSASAWVSSLTSPSLPESARARRPSLAHEFLCGFPRVDLQTREDARAHARCFPTMSEVGMEEFDEEPGWGIRQSADLYHIKGWGHPYFRINDAGHVE